MKKIITIISIILFFLGFLLSGFMYMYFKVEKYKKDIFIAEWNSSSRRGAINICTVGGHLKSNGKRIGVDCKLFHKFFPELRIGALPFGRPSADNKTIYEVDVFVSPNGGIHRFIEEENRYEPGVKALPLLSFQTFLMLPLPLLLLFNLFKYLFKRKRGVTIGLLVLFISPFLSGQQDELMSFQVRTVVSKRVEVEVVLYDSLYLKKTPFDTTAYLLQYPEECLLGEISATNEGILKYCSENKQPGKNQRHYQSIRDMPMNSLYFEPTMKMVQYARGDTTVWIKMFIVDNIRHRKIKSMRVLNKKNGRWQISKKQLDGDTGMTILSMKNDALSSLFLRKFKSGDALFEMQERCYEQGVFNLRVLTSEFKSWFEKGREKQHLIDKFVEQKLIQ